MNATAPIVSSSAGVEGYVSIPLHGLPFLDGLQVNVYRGSRPGADLPLLNDAQWKVSDEQIAELESFGHHCVFVGKPDVKEVAEQLRDCVSSIVGATSLSIESRFALLQFAYSTEFERTFRKAFLSKFVPLAELVGTQMAALAARGKMRILPLFQMLHHNSQHYTHLTNVTAYGLALARTMEKFSASGLEQLAVGCLLHEVGKLFLPEDLLSKRGRLSVQDTEELERVPQKAYETLLDFPQLQPAQLMMAYQQHERVDGTGYPVRSLCEDIHPWAKLLAVADELDAITCQRPYREAVGLETGLQHLARLANNKLDPKMVQCLINNSQSK